MHGAPVGGEVGGLAVRVPEEAEQIVGELARHLVHVDPERRRCRRPRAPGFPVQPGLLLPPDRGVEVRWRRVGSGGVVGGVEEAVEGGDEGGCGSARVGEWAGDGAMRGGEEEEEVDGGEEEEGADGEEAAGGGRARVREGGELLPRHGWGLARSGCKVQS